MANLGQLVIELDLDGDKLVLKAKSAEKTIKELTKHFDKIDTSVTKVEMSIGKLATALGKLSTSAKDVGKVAAGVEKLAASLTKLSKINFTKLGDASKNLNAIARSLETVQSKLNSINPTAFKNLAGAISSIATAANKITNVTTQLETMGRVLRELNAVPVSRLSSIASNISQLGAALRTINGISVTGMRNVTQGINNIVSAIQSLNGVQFGNLSRVTRAIADLGTGLNSLASVNPRSLAQIGTSIQRIGQAFVTMSSNMSALRGITSVFTRLATSLGTLATSLQHVVTLMTQMARLNGSLNNLGNNFNRASRGARGLLSHLRDIAIVGFGVQSTLSGIQTLFGSWLGPITSANAQLEKLGVLFKGVATGGSMEEIASKAKQDMDFVMSMAKSSPVALNELSNALVKMRAVDLENPRRQLTGLADAVAHFGGTDQEFHRATVAITQMASKGVVSMEELRQQLGEAVPGALQMMARGMRMTVREFVEAVSKGMVPAREALERMNTQFEQSFGGSAKAMMATWNGMVSQLKTTWLEFAKIIGDAGYFDASKGALQQLINLMRSDAGREFAYNFGQSLGQITTAVLEGVKWLIKYRQEIAEVGKVLVAVFVGNKITTALTALAALGLRVAAAWARLRTTMSALQSVFGLLGLAIARLGGPLSLLVTGIISAASYFDLFKGKVQSLNDTLDETKGKDIFSGSELGASLASMKAEVEKRSANIAEINKQLDAIDSKTKAVTSRGGTTFVPLSTEEKEGERSALLKRKGLEYIELEKAQRNIENLTKRGGEIRTQIEAKAEADIRDEVLDSTLELRRLWDERGRIAYETFNKAGGSKNTEALRVFNESEIEKTKALGNAEMDALRTRLDNVNEALKSATNDDIEVLKARKAAINRLMLETQQGMQTALDQAARNPQEDFLGSDKEAAKMEKKQERFIDRIGEKMTNQMAKIREKQSELLSGGQAETERSMMQFNRDVDNFTKTTAADKSPKKTVWTTQAEQLRAFAAEAEKATGVSKDLIAAVAHQESQFMHFKDGKVYTSAKGALGFMQLLPGTAGDYDVNPNDPRQNVLGGAMHLDMLIKKYGDLVKVLAAYNAGQGNLEKYGLQKILSGAGGFKETPGYVANVLRYLKEEKARKKEEYQLDVVPSNEDFQAEADQLGIEEAGKKWKERFQNLNITEALLDERIAFKRLGEQLENQLENARQQLNPENYNNEGQRAVQRLRKVATFGTGDNQALQELKVLERLAKARDDAENAVKRQQAERAAKERIQELRGAISEIQASFSNDPVEQAMRQAVAQVDNLRTAMLNAKNAGEELTNEEKNLINQFERLSITSAKLEDFGGMGRMLMQWQDMTQQMKNASSGWLDDFAEKLTEFVTTGKFKFREFATSVLTDIARIGIRQSIAGGFNLLFGGAENAAQANQGGATGAQATAVAMQGMQKFFSEIGNNFKGGVVSLGTWLSDSINKIFDAITQRQSVQQIAGLVTSVVGALSGAAGGDAGNVSFADVNSGTGSLGSGGAASFNAGSYSSLAFGGIMTEYGKLPLSRYAKGGIARKPQLALYGEGSRPEAFVPLPDGKTIPVTIRSGGAGGAQNNVSISINVSQNGDSSKESSGNSRDFDRMAERVRGVVIEELSRQQRQGGRLYR